MSSWSGVTAAMSAYDLLQRYTRSLGLVMSCSEAAICAEPERLEADGFVTNSDEHRDRSGLYQSRVPLVAAFGEMADLLAGIIDAPTPPVR